MRKKRKNTALLVALVCLGAVCVIGAILYVTVLRNREAPVIDYPAIVSPSPLPDSAGSPATAPDAGPLPGQGDGTTQSVEGHGDTSGQEPVAPEPADPAGPPQGGINTMSLEDAILYANEWVRLGIQWTNGTRTVFERDRDSQIWTMESRDGRYRMVEPDFSSSGGTFTIGFPTTKTRYTLMSDHTGSFGNEAMTWIIETNPSYSKMSESGTRQTYDLYNALGKYMLLIIRINWNNGETTIFYQQDNGTWMMKGRSGSFTSVEPSFSGDAEEVYMGFPTTSTKYVLYTGGSGRFGDESLTRNFDFSDR